MSSDVLPADGHVRARIATELGRNFLVEAGAGSGKTHSLAERMASGVASGVYLVSNMAAVTFTRKAAAELRGRFQLALEARVAARPAETERTCLNEALADIERFFAGTIHAFCARLLRERPVEARMAPGFVELDEVEDARARQRAWRDYLTRESTRGSSLLALLRSAGVRPPDLDAAFSLVCDHADVDFPSAPVPLPASDGAWGALEACWSQIKANLPHPIEEASTCGVQKLARTFESRWELARRDRPAELAELLVEWDRLKVVKKWWGTGESRGNVIADRVAASVERFQGDSVAPYLQQWRAWVYEKAVRVLLEGREFYADERRRHNVVNYVDLLMMAARVLREDAAVRRALQQKFRWLFVDEFQDTDPIQAEVFMLLAAEEPSEGRLAEPMDWTRVPLRPGALFVVGDPKQSIYRFRRADIDIYNQVRDRIVSCGGERLGLTANFRSRPAICEFANRVFHTRFPAESTAEAPAFERLQPVRPDGDTVAPAVRVLSLPPGTPTRSSPRVEAAAIAAWIGTQVSAGRLAFGDVLVLTRNRPRLKVYAEVFEDAGIPVEVSGAGSFGGSPEVETLRGLLESLADPLDTAAVVGVLRGPLFGVSDVDLFRYRQAEGRFDFTVPHAQASETPLPASTEPFGPALDAIRLMNRLFRWTRRLPLAAALERILEASGMLALAATSTTGAHAGDLLQALDRVRQVAEHGGGLADAAEVLSEEAVEASDVEALPLEPGRRAVVRLMNLHKAKGLEADVVFLADPCNGARFEPEIRIQREGLDAKGWLRIARKLEDKFGDVLLAQPADWDLHHAVERRYLDAEQDRLLYVAATRARELLIVGRSTTSRENKAWGALDPFVADAASLPDPAPVEPRPSVTVSVGDPTTEARAAAAAGRDQRRRLAARPSWDIASVTDDARQTARAGRIRRTVSAEPGQTPGEHVEVTDPTASLLPASPSHRADAGAAWGVLIHGLLEYAMPRPAASRADLERLARWLLLDHADLRPFVGEALSCVEAVMQAPLWSAARSSAACFVEVPFVHRLSAPVATQRGGAIDVPGVGREASSRSPVQISLFEAPSPVDPAQPSDLMPTLLLRGVIDLAYGDSNGWLIVDYKTDQILVDLSELVARYGDQVTRYVQAWQDASRQRVERAELFHTRTLRAVVVPTGRTPG